VNKESVDASNLRHLHLI